MADTSQSGPKGVIILTAVLSVISALGVAYLSFQSKSVESNVKMEEIAFQQSKFDAEEKKRYETVVEIIIPKILSKDEQESKVGMATLFVLFPDRARQVLVAVESALTESQKASLKPTLQPALESAQKLEETPDGWIIIAGADKTFDEAKTEIERAKRQGYSPTLYLKDNMFRTTIGPYPSRTDADRTNIAVRVTLRNSAYVVNLQSWCPSQTKRDHYIECRAS